MFCAFIVTLLSKASRVRARTEDVTCAALELVKLRFVPGEAAVMKMESLTGFLITALSSFKMERVELDANELARKRMASVPVASMMEPEPVLFIS